MTLLRRLNPIRELLGIEQGMVKGEKQKAIEIAKNLIDILDSKTIAAKTGLTEKEIEILRAK